MSSGIQDRLEHAQVELSEHVGEMIKPYTANNLWSGLTTLRELLLNRLHSDIEVEFGIDSSVAPATAGAMVREMGQAAEEIEAYSLVLVIDEVTRSGYARSEIDWFRNWLLRLRWGDEMNLATLARMQSYEKHNDGERRRMFASYLEQAIPEATKTPLIIYRLFPRAVRIVTALAFGDTLRAREIRGEQISYLPVIGDCHHCHGLPLENGETCVACGNPLWKIKWLSATE
jgi:hypothetical protein